MTMGFSGPAWSRRRFVSSAGIVATVAILSPRVVNQAIAQSAGFRDLRARPGLIRLRGPDIATTAIWGYDGGVPGPTIRVKRGEELKVRLINELPEPTLVHWHGVRVPNSMDGALNLTQSSVESGQSFEYRFTPPDAGTFWYHASYSPGQQERGLYGALIVDEPTPVDVDRDVVLVLDDWRLNEDGLLDMASQSAGDAAHGSRPNPLLTANSENDLAIPVRRNERVRLRLINAANARIMPVSVPGLTAWVVAIDGQPVAPFVARDSLAVLAPGSRVDLFVDVADDKSVAPIMVETTQGDVPIARFVIEGDLSRTTPRGEPKSLPQTPLPAQIDLKSALRVEVQLNDAATNQPVDRSGLNADLASHWSLAGRASSGPSRQPLFSVKRGRPVTVAFINKSAVPHVIHVHGHHFRLLDSLDDGWKPFWLDTLLVAPRQTARIAFVADNPGKWMIHRHALDERDTRLATWFQVSKR